MKKPVCGAEYFEIPRRLELRWQSLEQLLPEEARGVCLDLGCGGGRHRQVLENKGFKWIGVDVEVHGHLSAVADAHTLPFRENSFDLVFMSQVLEHLPHPWKALREVYRVLKPGGTLCGSVAYVEPWYESYFHFSHWGVEQILLDTGFEIKMIKPGASVFLMVAHSMFDGPGIEMATHFVNIFVPPFMFLWETAALVYVRLKFGRQSEVYEKLQRYFETLPYRFAGQIKWLAKKPKGSK